MLFLSLGRNLLGNLIDFTVVVQYSVTPRLQEQETLKRLHVKLDWLTLVKLANSITVRPNRAKQKTRGKTDLFLSKVTYFNSTHTV